MSGDVGYKFLGYSWAGISTKTAKLVENACGDSNLRQVPLEESLTNLSKTIRDLQTERNRLLAKLNALDNAISVLGGLSGSRGRGPRRKMSPAARKRIAAAQRARWAKWKVAQKKG